MIHDTMLSRRRLLQGGSAALAAGFAGTMPALAKAPMLGTQAPYFYRFKIGNAEATIVSDGPLPLGDPNAAFLGLTRRRSRASSTAIFCRSPMPCSSRTR